MPISFSISLAVFTARLIHILICIRSFRCHICIDQGLCNKTGISQLFTNLFVTVFALCKIIPIIPKISFSTSSFGIFPSKLSRNIDKNSARFTLILISTLHESVSCYSVTAFLKIHRHFTPYSGKQETILSLLPQNCFLLLCYTIPLHVQLRQYHYSALPTDPNNSIFSLTVALIASAPGARSLRGSNPLP